MQLRENGVFAIDKPQYFTSFDVVAKLRGILGIRKIGHGGTLDPLATGVLPIFIGKATKAVDLVADSLKRYTVTVKIGIKTDTGDITGDITERSSVIPDEATLREVLSSFIGVGEQIPPMYSAIKVNGRHLYDIARSGAVVERNPRPIEILSINLLNYDQLQKEFKYEVYCSKGTYIRTLTEDIAFKLSTVATVFTLRRTQSGPFSEDDCLTFETITKYVNAGDRDFILPVESLFSSLKSYTLSDKQNYLFMNGVSFPVDCIKEDEVMLKILYKGKMIALGKTIEGNLKSVAKFV